MGYSCTASAANALDFILDYISGTDAAGTSNGWAHSGKRYFFERGRENADGAITGTVYRTGIYTPREGEPYEACFKAGSVKIAADGKVVRFPAIPRWLRINIKGAYAGGVFEHYHLHRTKTGSAI